MEERDILRDHRDGRAQMILSVHSGDGLPVEQHPAMLHIVEALDEADEVDLPAPEGPTRPYLLAGRDAQARSSSSTRCPPG